MLTGTWDFYPDVGEASLTATNTKPGTIQVPGAWQAQGYGDAGGTIPSANIGPGTSPAEYLRHNLMARCLYVRDVDIPASWQGRRVFLSVRRAYRYTDVVVNGKRMGEYEGFCTPFEFDVTEALTFGGRNRLVIGVDNRPRAGRDTLGTANLNGNWGGLGGAVYLEARPTIRIEDIFAMPRIEASQVNLRVTVTVTGTDRSAKLSLRAEVAPWDPTGRSTLNAGEAARTLGTTNSWPPTVELPVSIAPLHCWTPDDPFLYLARVKLLDEGRVVDELSVRFGMREITVQGRKLVLNGKPLYLSGYGDDATEPIGGMLPADKSVYRQRLTLMRSLGFNFVRHHSCVPHDEYLDAADEVGMLVQPEAGMAYTKFWPTGYRLFEQEWPHLIRAFRNHPSIWAWCTGNELFLNELPARGANSAARDGSQASANAASTAPAKAPQVDPGRREVMDMVAKAYRQAKELDPTRLVHASDGGTPQEFSDVLSPGGWERVSDREWAKNGYRPFLLHEYGTYCCSLPDFSLIPRLNGLIRPLTYERAERYVREQRLEAVYPRLYRSSLRMRADAQKYYIESAKASGANSGFSFWLGVDFPDSPEGCWDEGILNQLWEPKPFLTDSIADYAGPTVLLTKTALNSRSFYGGEAKAIDLEILHQGAPALNDARIEWRVTEGERTLKTGELAVGACALGEKKSAGQVVINGLASAAPRFVTLQVELWEGPRRVARNAWEFFAYPRGERTELVPGVYSEAGNVEGAMELKADQPIPENMRLLITREWKRDRLGQIFRRGKAAVLLLGTGGFKETRAGYFLNQYGAGFGGVVEEHPVFAEIPHEGRIHPGLYQLIAGGGLLDADSMPAALRDGAVVWGLQLTGWISPVKNLRKAALFCEVMGENDLHLMLCNLDLLADKPESRYVLRKTLEYLASGRVSDRVRRRPVAELEALLR